MFASGKLFTGEYFDDAISLQYNRARWYAPSVGRFLSIDPLGGKQYHPISFNKYIYADSSPITNLDPSGGMTLLDTSLASKEQGNLNVKSGASTAPQFTGRAATEAGKAFENQILNAIKNCLKPGADIRKITKFDDLKDSAGRLAMPDFLLSIGNKFKILEVKTKLPNNKISDSLERAAKQLDAAIRTKYPAAILSKVKHRESTFSKRKDEIEKMLGANAGVATYLNGTIAIMGFIGEFVVEECVENALGF